MIRSTIFALALVASAPCACGAAETPLVLTAHVQRVVLQPPGTADCPPSCSRPSSLPPNTEWVCISNDGGCETLDVTVDQVLLGSVAGPQHVLQRRIGEWGPRFPCTSVQLAIVEDEGNISWSTITLRDKQRLIDPTRIRRLGRVDTATLPATADNLVSLEDLIDRAKRAQ
jgi:hypothetical protein